MPTQLLRRAPAIARSLVEVWKDHEEALDKVPLPYIDHLIEASLARESMKWWQLRSRLVDMTPRLLEGTAARLIDLKFQDADRGAFLPNPIS